MCAAIINRLRRFFNDEHGPTAVEYAVMLALIIAVAFGAISQLGTVSRKPFKTTSSTLDNGVKTDGNEDGNGQY